MVVGTTRGAVLQVVQATTGFEQPTYLALAEALTTFLRDAGPGSRLPSENDLTRDHGVSRVTARAALQELERRHLVRRVRGVGTFAALRIDYPISTRIAPSWSATLRAAGHDATYELVEVRRADAPAELAVLTDAVHVVRRGAVDGQVATYARSWIPSGLLHDARRALDRHGSLCQALIHEAGVVPARRWSRAELVLPPAEVADLLEVEPRLMAWRIDSCNEHATTGGLVELSSSWLRADVFRVRFELDSGARG